MKTLAIITARGGSKRIPRKNIRPFCGKPILAYSIRAALDSGCFDAVMCSTDDEEIAGIARECGAEVPFMRSKETASDYAMTNDVLREVIGCYRERGLFFDYFCCIYPTAPFLSPENLRRGYEKIADGKANGAMSVVRGYPLQGALTVESGCLTMLHPEYARTRSQDLPETYYDVGEFYWVKTSLFCENSHSGLLELRLAPVVLSGAEVQDIDTEDDWREAELKYRLLQIYRGERNPERETRREKPGERNPERETRREKPGERNPERETRREKPVGK